MRYTRIFFGILTLALSQVLWSLAFKFFWVTGGTDGLRVPAARRCSAACSLQGPRTRSSSSSTPTTTTCSAFSSSASSLMWVIVHSPFGKALQAIRDNETRARVRRHQIRRYRWVAFLISGTVHRARRRPLGAAERAHHPDILYWTFSGEIVFMTVLGGFRTFTGPIVGAIVFNYLKTYAVGHTVYWQMVLGIVLVVLVLVLPTGIVGTLRGWPRAAAGGRDMSLLETVNLRSTSATPTPSTTSTSPSQEGEFLALIGLQRRGQDHAGQPDQRASAADSGQIIFRGRGHHPALGAPSAIKAGIARSFQLVNLFDQLTALDNVALAIFSRQGKTRKAVGARATRPRGAATRRRDVLGQFGLASKARCWRGGLSQGERKLLDVAVAYALRPKLLFLDEPTSGVSTREKAQIMDTSPRWCAARASPRSSSSTTWTWCSPTPTASSPCTRGRSWPTARPTRSANNEQVAMILLGAPARQRSSQA